MSMQHKDTSLSIKIAQKPHIIGSLGPKAFKYESFDAKGLLSETPCLSLCRWPTSGSTLWAAERHRTMVVAVASGSVSGR